MTTLFCLPVHTVRHFPRMVRPFLASALCHKFSLSLNHGLWGIARVLMFPKLVLRSPPRAGRKKHYLVGPLLREHLQQWTSGTGILVGTPSALSSFLDILQHQGPSYGLHSNLSKCEVFWPSGDQLLWVSLQLLSM